MAELKPAPDGYPIKLVRNKTEKIVNPSGVPGDLWYKALEPYDKDLHVKLLRQKLLEETGEYIIDGGVDELSDVISVLEALAQAAHGVPLDDVLNFARTDPRGGFTNAVVMYGHHPEFDGR